MVRAGVEALHGSLGPDVTIELFGERAARKVYVAMLRAKFTRK